MSPAATKTFLPDRRKLFASFAISVVFPAPFTPVIKKIIDRFEKNEIKNLILLMILVWSILAIIPKTKTYFSDFTSFIMIYMVGAYIKKYNINIIKNNNKRKIILLITIALLIAITIGLMFLSAKVPLLQNYIHH